MTGPAASTEDRAAILEAEKAALETELARLRDSERMYRYSAAMAGRLVWKADAAGAMLFLDDPFVVLTGMSVERGKGSGWFDVVHPDDRARTTARWARSVETGE